MKLFSLPNIILIANTLVNIALAFLVIQRSRKLANILYAIFVSCISLWIFSNASFQFVETKNAAFIWALISYDAALLIAGSLVMFTYAFPNSRLASESIFGRIHKVGVVVVSVLTMIFVSIPGIVLKDVVIEQPRKLITTTWLPFYGFVLLVFFIWALINLSKNYFRSSGNEKQQVKFVLSGLVMSVLFGISFNLLLPLVGNYSFVWLGPDSAIILIIAVGYAIIRHRLLDIRLVISRSILYVLLLVIVAFLFTLNIFLVGPLFGDTYNTRLIITIVSTLAIVFGLDPLKKLIARLTDKVFFKAPIDYNEVLRVLSERTSVEVDLGELTHGVQEDVTRTLKLHKTEVLLINNLGDLCRRNETSGELEECVAYNNPALEHLQTPGKFIDRDGLERKIEDTKDNEEKAILLRSLSAVDKLQAAFIAPITARGRLNAALVLGRKLSGDSFNTQETSLLKVLGPQIGSAIEKAKLFEEVKHFSEKLQVEIDRATSELKERNRFLLALQDITSLITHTLDYKKVTQEIVDGISKKLGYVAGLLLLRDKETGVTWAEAVTETAITHAAFKLLPIPVSSFRGSINDPDLASQAMRIGEVTESDDLAKFLNPPIPATICHAIQKLTRIKYIIAVPIVIEDEIIGSLIYTIAKPVSEISKQERSMMKALADQTGIVIRNLQLFEKIEQANHELEKANDHLRVLDEAKSEFISIASHQLRTPMTGIMGYLSMLVGGDFGKLDPAIAKILESILAASKRMIRLINIFLNVTKIEAGRFEVTKKPTQIENIVDTEFVELQKLAKDKNIKLVFNRPKTPLPEVSVDRDKLADVFQNLIDNAIKYTPEGSVTVDTEIFGTELIVRVKDTGRGLAKGDAEKLFNKFVRGDGIARIHPDGSGLGLYIAKKIVEAHGGRIWVESKGEGKGSSFNFAVPLNS